MFVAVPRSEVSQECSEPHPVLGGSSTKRVRRGTRGFRRRTGRERYADACTGAERTASTKNAVDEHFKRKTCQPSDGFGYLEQLVEGLRVQPEFPEPTAFDTDASKAVFSLPVPVPCAQNFRLRAEAFRLLAEDFDGLYGESYDPAPQSLWNPPHKKSPLDTAGWPLDLPDVGTIDVEECCRFAREEGKAEAVPQALALISSPEAYHALSKPFGNGPSGDRAWIPRQSFNFARFKNEIKSKGFAVPISRRAIKKFVFGFTIPKVKKKKLRTLLDGRPQNELQKEPPHVQLAGLQDVIDAVVEYPLAQELDGTGFFHQFKLHPDIAAEWVLKIGKERLAWTRMPMGWSHAVYVAHTVACFLADLAIPDVRVLVYIDNIYIFGRSKELIEWATQQFLERCKRVNATFEITTPVSPSLTVLGVSCNLAEKSVSMPESFIVKLQNVLDCLPFLFLSDEHAHSGRSQGAPTARLLWKIFGSIMWSARVLAIPMYCYGNFLAWISRKAGHLSVSPDLWDAPSSIWPSARTELKRLIQAVLKNTPRDVSIIPHSHPTQNVHSLYTDASDVGYAAVHLGAKLTGPSQHRWAPNMAHRIIAERELYALVEGVAEAKQGIRRLDSITAYNDNTNVIAWVTRRKAKSPFGNFLLRRLFSILGRTKIVMSYVPSEKNLADHPSRFF